MLSKKAQNWRFKSRRGGGRAFPYSPPLTIDPNILSGGPHRYSWHFLKNFWNFFWNFSKKIFFDFFLNFFSKFHFSQKNIFWKITKNREQIFWSKILKKNHFFIFLSECFGEHQKCFSGIVGHQKVLFSLGNKKENFNDFGLMLSILSLFT